MQETKNFLALMVFKGMLLTDAHGLLTDQGPNSRSARRIEFTSTNDVRQYAKPVRACTTKPLPWKKPGLKSSQRQMSCSLKSYRLALTLTTSCVPHLLL